MTTQPTTAVRSDGDRYELLFELASGGMATVYLARMRRPMGFSRLVAIKCMHPQFAKDPEFATMFVDEARLTARLRHPNIVPTLDIVADDGHLLLVMEYVEGASIAGLCKASSAAKARVPVAIAAAVVHDLLLGLHAAHEATDDEGAPLAIIHRDVSPQNVIVGVDGMARVLDFGVARARHNVHHSTNNEIKGKVPYMPPEQLCGEALDRRVDVYAAGVILWEMLVGKRLFEGPSETIIARRVLDDVVVPPSARIDGIAPELDRLVLKALAREATDRFATALEMAEELSRIVSPASRTEVAAWVRSLAPAAPSPPSSGALPSAPSAPSLPSEAPTSIELTTIVAVLERAQTKRSDAQEHDAPSAPHVPRRARFVGGLVGVACVLAAALVAKAALVERPAAAATPVSANVAPPAAAATGSAPISPETAAMAPAIDSAPAARAAKPRARTAAIVAKPAPAIEAKPAAAEPAPAPAAPATDGNGATCRPPYTVDADGHRHYKVECI